MAGSFLTRSLPRSLQRPPDEEVRCLEADLDGLRTSIMELSEDDHPTSTHRCLMNRLRELSYDAEDYLEMLRHSGLSAGCSWHIHWVLSKVRGGRRRPPLLSAKDISELRSRVKDAIETRQAYLQSGSSETTTKICRPQAEPDNSRRITSASLEPRCLDEPMNELDKVLALDSDLQLKVVAIFGLAGVGKTTLATRLYHCYRGRFQCGAFLRVSRKPERRRLLASVLSQIKGRPYHGSWDEQDLIHNIKQYLHGKSYFIIVDDIWATSVWDLLSRAFPVGNCCSRIVTTTQIEDVAFACGNNINVLNMRSLSIAQSLQLFRSRINHIEGYDYDNEECKEVSYRIAKACGDGLPLAVINIAGMLSAWPDFLMKEWVYVQNSLSRTSQGIEGVLNLIYNNIPPRLKTCLLYLSIYPEDCVTRKDDLVKQWVAEGIFGQATEDDELNNQGGYYFDELLQRGLIQPAHTGYNNQVLSCTVHNMVLDFIAHKAMQENFITVINYPETVSGPSEKVHRLSIRFGGAKSARIPERLSISQVRSLRFSGFFKCVPSLVECWLLRVLILDIWSDQDEEILDLTLIGELLQLRYLKIESNMVIKLPTVIGRLMYLQTLDVAAKVATFPLDIYCLKTLWHLRLPREPWPFSRMSVLLLHSIGLVRRIGDLTSLRSLSNLNLSACPGDDVRDLGNLTNMQDLHLTCSAAPSSRQQVSNIEWLVSSLWKSSQLKTLILDSEVSSNTIISCDGLSSTVSCSDPSLESFQLSPRAYILSNLPKWVRCLSNLRILKIAVRDFIASVDVGVLEELSVLAVLSLHVRTTPAEKIIFSKGFQALKYFKFTCNALCVEFTGVAMHQVQTLKLSFNVDTMNQYKPEDAGIRGLPGLEVISVKIGGASTDQSSREAAKRRLVNAFIGYQQPRHLRFLEENHQQSPIINVKTVDVIIHGDTELSSSVDVITRGGPDEQHIVEETDINGVADSRIISWEPSSFTQKPGWVNWRPRNGVRLFKTVQGIAYVMRQHMKHAGFRVLNEVASVNQDMERLTMIIDSSPDSQPQEWVLQVQDLAYDIQDFVDIYNWLRIRSQSHALAHVSNIVQLKESIRTLREWQHSGISSHHGVSGSSAVSSGLPSSSCPCVPEDRLVGIEEPMSELLELVLLPGEFEKATKQLRMSSIMGITMEQLAYWHAKQEIKRNVRSLERPTEVQKPRRQLRFVEGDVVDQVVYLPSPTPAEEYRLRVISIVGYRGIGKTALARAVYDVANTVHSTSDLRCGAFDRLAWVVASQCSHAGDILNSIYQQVREQGNDPVTDTYMFKESLRNKRFLVVIDDLQAAGLWYDVQSAFPEAHTGSRVIVTTSIGSVASACSSDRYIYRMRGLGYSNAEKLFWARVDCRTNRTPFLEYALQDTLRKSGGLPLALISVANYLCRKRQDLLPGAPGAFEEMNRVLSHCYNSLPDNGHRTCFLSLSAFPQGQLIKRKKLIRRWIAEGLAVGDSVLSAEQVASNRFDELIDRSLIEPVLTGNNSKVKGFLVLGVIKDFIVNKSVSKEFVTLIQNDELLFPNKKVAHPVRRLSVQGGTHSERVAKGIELDRVRSLTICNTVPFDFKDCWLLRLLDLDACQGIDKIVFHNICKLVFLKYLNLRGSDVYKISKKIKKLECLETLDIRDTRVETLPIEVLMLPCLAHLFGQFELPQKLKDPAIRSKLQAFFSHKSRLQTLSGFVMVENNGFEHIVLHMRLLRKVTIWCRHSITSSYQRHLLTSSLQKRLAGRNALDSVSINFGNESINFLNNIEAPCALIGSMKLWGRLKSLPSFITSHDTTLSELQLSSTGLTIEALSLLQNLRRLLYLKIVEDGDGFFGDCFIVQSGGFPSLLRLCFEALKLPKVHIHEGGMSSLTSLHLLCPELATFNSTVLEESYTDTYPEKSFRGVHSGRDLKEVYPKIRFKETDSVIIRSDEIVEENDEINTKGKSKEIKRTDSETSFNEIDLGTTDSKKIKNKIDLKELVKGIEHLQHLNELVLHPSVSREILDAWKEEARGYINIPKVTRGCTSMLSLNRGSSGTTKKKVGYKVQTSDRHVLVEVPAEQSEISGMQSEGIKGGNLSTPTSSVRLLLELRKYILLQASVVAMVTYAAGGFSPPGGVLKDTAAGHVADVSILRDTQFHRYLVFYFNATAFAASLLVIILVFIIAFLDDKEAEDSNSSRIICHYRKNRRIVVRSLRVIMLSDLLALMGAYAAATYQRDTFVNVYSWLPLFFVSVYLATKMALALFFTESSGVLEAHEAELLKAEERYRKVLLVLATFAVSITYTAGLSTPWGIWDTTTEAGHRPGDGFLKDLDKTRLKVFFGFNTAAFAASLLIVMMLLDSKLRKNLDYRRLNVFFSFGIAVFVASLLIIAELLDSKLRSKNNAAFGLIVLMLGSLVGAYIAGCCRQADTTIYMVSLVAAVVVYILFLSIRRAITNQRAESNSGRNEQGNQEASEYGPTEEEDSGAYKVRSLVMLLATLAATITYQAGLDPPGGIWQDNKDGHMAGDPILLTVNARRYNAFFYCNSFAFAASLVAITILLVQKMSVLRHRLLNVLMTLNLLGLVGAYVAGASRDSRSSIYALGLAPVVFLYVGVHVALMRVQGLLQPHNIRDVVQLVDNMRKRLLLFAIFLTTMTYKAGLTPPGGFLLQDNHPAGHHAGDPVLSYIAPHRYKAFFYCNTVSFMLSIVLIIFLGIPPLYRQAIVRSHALSVCTAAGFHGLMGAYAAGSTQHLKTYIYIFVLSAVVVCFLFIQLMVYWFTRGGPPDVMVMTIGDSTTTQGAAVETNSQGNKATKKKRMHAKRQYLMLLGILGATVTYQAALKPPGGAWQSSSGDYKAGNPIMYDNRRTRYLVFFYSNSTSFMASIVVILLQLEPKRLFGHHQKAWLRRWLIQTIILDLLGFLGAYAAGSTRAIKTSLYVILLFIAVLLAYSGMPFLLLRIMKKKPEITE